MHDTACCFGYPSDSSRTARKRAGTLDWAGLRPYHATSSTRADATSATAPGPSCGRARCRSLRAGQDWAGRVATSATSPGPLCGCGRCSLCSLSPGWRRALPISQWSWVSAGLPIGAPDRRHASPLMSPQGAAVGRGPGWRCSGWIAISTVQGAAGPWSRAYHWHVCWAGVLRAPDRQQRAAASAWASPGRAQSGYRPSESPCIWNPYFRYMPGICLACTTYM
jgi:hypothetical protein